MKGVEGGRAGPTFSSGRQDTVDGVKEGDWGRDVFNGDFSE